MERRFVGVGGFFEGGLGRRGFCSGSRFRLYIRFEYVTRVYCWERVRFDFRKGFR